MIMENEECGSRYCPKCRQAKTEGQMYGTGRGWCKECVTKAINDEKEIQQEEKNQFDKEQMLGVRRHGKPLQYLWRVGGGLQVWVCRLLRMFGM